MQDNYYMVKYYFFIFLLGIISLLIIIFGFKITGSPLEQKELNYDSKRRSDFSQIGDKIEEYIVKTNRLPDSLEELKDKANIYDPKSKEAYAYEIVSDIKYNLCTEFYKEYNSDTPTYPGSYTANIPNKNHKKGFDCIEYEIPSYKIKTSPTPTKKISISTWKIDKDILNLDFDTEGKIYAGIISNTTYAPGKIGRALYFNKSYLSIPGHDSIKDIALSDFTVMLWAKRNGNGNQYLITTTNSYDGGFALLSGNTGEVYCRTSDGTNFTDSHTGYNGNYLLTDNKWHHIAIIKKESLCSIYIDGVDRTAAHGNHSSVAPAKNPLTIGDRPDHQDESFWGYLDEIKMYNYALTENQILTHYDPIEN